MRIEFVEIANFRKLLSTRVGLSSERTIFVGANNSGKTSAITALRYFLVDQERSSFCFNDFTLAHWPSINTMGAAWEAAHVENLALPTPEWDLDGSACGCAWSRRMPCNCSRNMWARAAKHWRCRQMAPLWLQSKARRPPTARWPYGLRTLSSSCSAG